MKAKVLIPTRWAPMALALLTSLSTPMQLGLLPFAEAKPKETAPFGTGWEEPKAQITQLLDLDRFLYYKQAWLDNFNGKRPANLVSILKSVSAEDALPMVAKEPAAFADPMQYDSLLVKFAQMKSPTTKIDKADIEWNYNFFKRKLKDAFALNPEPANTLDGLLPELPARTRSSEARQVPPHPMTEVLLDVDQYISNRTTRAVLWDSALNHRPIEFHLGTERAFRTRLQARGGTMLAEVKPAARNYNKIYLVKYPERSALTYAFTRISGEDRLDHLIRQLSLIRINGKSADLNGKVMVYGEANRISAQIEQSLTRFLERVPRADLVIIGQKGGLEGILRGAYSLQGLAQLEATNPQIIESRLGAAEHAKLKKLLAASQASGSYLSDFKRIADADKFADVLKQDLATTVGVQSGQEKVFDIENISHDMSDVILKTTDGQERRWRLISNVWGDEVTPIAKALVKTGHQRVIAIGTAGALHSKDLKVGDLVEAKRVYQEGKGVEAITGSVFTVKEAKPATVGHVTTPYAETQDWLKAVHPNIDVIELETAYLHSVFKGKAQFQSFFLISDVVGSENETLAAAESSSRKRALLALLKNVFTQEKVARIVPSIEHEGLSLSEAVRIQKKLEELAPKRSLESRFQLAQIALQDGLKTDDEFKNLIDREKAFSRDILNKVLTTAGHVASVVDEAMDKAGRPVRMYLPSEFMTGRWNPSKGLDILVQASSPSDKAAVDAEIRRLLPNGSPLAKIVRIQTTDREPEARWLQGSVASADSSHFISDLYTDIALSRGGLHSMINTSGQMRFARVDSLRTDGSGSMPNLPSAAPQVQVRTCEAIFIGRAQ